MKKLPAVRVLSAFSRRRTFHFRLFSSINNCNHDLLTLCRCSSSGRCIRFRNPSASANSSAKSGSCSCEKSCMYIHWSTGLWSSKCVKEGMLDDCAGWYASTRRKNSQPRRLEYGHHGMFASSLNDIAWADIECLARLNFRATFRLVMLLGPALCSLLVVRISRLEEHRVVFLMGMVLCTGMVFEILFTGLVSSELTAKQARVTVEDWRSRSSSRQTTCTTLSWTVSRFTMRLWTPLVSIMLMDCLWRILWLTIQLAMLENWWVPLKSSIYAFPVFFEKIMQLLGVLIEGWAWLYRESVFGTESRRTTRDFVLILHLALLHA